MVLSDYFSLYTKSKVCMCNTYAMQQNTSIYRYEKYFDTWLYCVSFTAIPLLNFLQADNYLWSNCNYVMVNAKLHCPDSRDLCSDWWRPWYNGVRQNLKVPTQTKRLCCAIILQSFSKLRTLKCEYEQQSILFLKGTAELHGQKSRMFGVCPIIHIKVEIFACAVWFLPLFKISF